MKKRILCNKFSFPSTSVVIRELSSEAQSIVFVGFEILDDAAVQKGLTM